MPPTKHARRSPSALKNYKISPCYLPSGGTNEAAERGTACHEAVETNKDDGLSEEELGHVTTVRNYLKEVRRGVPRDSQELQEIKLKMTSIGKGKRRGKKLTYGTCDYLILCPDDRAHLLDWKFGAWQVEEASENIQMRAYAVGVFQTYPNIKEVMVHLVQPKTKHVSVHIYRREADYAEMVNELESILSDAVLAEKENIYIPSVDTCRFCRRVASCPAIQMRLFPQMAKMHSSRWDNVERPLDYGGITAENASDRQELAAIAEAWASTTKAENVNRVVVEGAPEPEGYKLVTEVPQVFAAGAARTLYDRRAEIGLTPKELLGALKPTKGALAEAVKANAARGEKKLAEEGLYTFLGESGVLTPGTMKTYLRKKSKKELEKKS